MSVASFLALVTHGYCDLGDQEARLSVETWRATERLQRRAERVKQKRAAELLSALQAAMAESDAVSGCLFRLTPIRKQRKVFTTHSIPDGTVVHVSPGGRVWINLGHEHGVRTGLRFQAYSFRDREPQRIAGMLEVDRVEQELSGCTLISGEAVRTGDQIRNPFYDPEGEPVVVVLLGASPSLELDHLRRGIERAGGRVEQSITIRTDLAIPLQGAPIPPGRVERAIQFGVTFLEEFEAHPYFGGLR